jgi:hypothetical protein
MEELTTELRNHVQTYTSLENEIAALEAEKVKQERELTRQLQELEVCCLPSPLSLSPLPSPLSPLPSPLSPFPFPLSPLPSPLSPLPSLPSLSLLTPSQRQYDGLDGTNKAAVAAAEAELKNLTAELQAEDKKLTDAIFSMETELKGKFLLPGTILRAV